MEVRETLALPRPRPSLLADFMELNWSTPTTKLVFGSRVLIVTSTIFFLLLRRMRPDSEPSGVTCIWDGAFQATDDMNAFLEEHSEYRSALLIFASVLLDILMVTSALRFVLWPKNLHSLMFLLTFYGVRGIIMSFFIMSFPEGHIFTHPGFPSLTVTYEKTSDFFYSGHVGFATFGVLENKLYGNRFMTVLACGSVAVECIVMVVTRGHYVIDLIAGLVFAHYVWEVTGWAASYVDRRLQTNN